MGLKYYQNNEYVSGSSRYQVLRVISENNDRSKPTANPFYLETYNDTKVPETGRDQYHLVLPEEKDRIDIIANKYYGDSSYWWAIALANDIIDPFIIDPNTILRIPSLLSLTLTGNVLSRRVE